MSREAERSMRCSEQQQSRQRALRSSRSPTRRRQEVEDLPARGEEGEAEVQCVRSAAEAVEEEEAKRPLPQRRKTVVTPRAKVRMVCQSLSAKSCRTRYGSRIHMTKLECHRSAQMGSSRAS